MNSPQHALSVEKKHGKIPLRMHLQLPLQFPSCQIPPSYKSLSFCFLWSSPPPEWSTPQVLSLLGGFAWHTPCVSLLFLFSNQAVVEWHGTEPSVRCVLGGREPAVSLSCFCRHADVMGSEPPRCPFQWEKINWCYKHTHTHTRAHTTTPHESHSSPAEGYL